MAYYRANIEVRKVPGLDYKTLLGTVRKHERSKITFDEDTDRFTITITSEDLAALRASMNAVMRDMQVIEGATEPQRNP